MKPFTDRGRKKEEESCTGGNGRDLARPSRHRGGQCDVRRGVMKRNAGSTNIKRPLGTGRKNQGRRRKRTILRQDLRLGKRGEHKEHRLHNQIEAGVLAEVH